MSESSPLQSTPTSIYTDRYNQAYPKILEELFQSLGWLEAEHASFKEATAYALAGGKRFRATLIYACESLSSLSAGDADRLAFSIEALHSYTLVHDDLPALDNDDLRRGLPALHVRFGEGQGLLVGDALQALAFASLSKLSSDLLPHAYSILSRAACDVALGQSMDLDLAKRSNPSLAEVLSVSQKKTASLIQAALELGSLNEPALQAQASKLGQVLGLGFQLQDDLQDWEDQKAPNALKQAMYRHWQTLYQKGLQNPLLQRSPVFQALLEKVNTSALSGYHQNPPNP